MAYLHLQFSNIFGFRILLHLKMVEAPKNFCLCGLFLWMFTILKIKTEKCLRHKNTQVYLLLVVSVRTSLQHSVSENLPCALRKDNKEEMSKYYYEIVSTLWTLWEGLGSLKNCLDFCLYFAFFLKTPNLYNRILCDHKNVYCIKYSVIVKNVLFWRKQATKEYNWY